MTQIKKCTGCIKIFQSEQDLLKGTGKWRLDRLDRFIFDCDQCGKTNHLEHNEVPWFSTTPKTDPSEAFGLSRLLIRSKFPHLPMAVIELSSLLRDPNSTPQEIALAAKKDPLIGAGILHIANNLKSSSGRPISSLEHAVTYVGRETVLLITLTAALGIMKTKTSKFRAREFWKEAFLIGHLAEYLAGEFSLTVHKDQAFIAGSLCNIGKLVNAIYTPEATDKIAIISRIGDNPKTWINAERMESALDHTKSGEFAGVNWGLPKFVLDSIRHHHDLPKFGVDRSKGLNIVEIVSLANQLMHYVNKQPYRSERDIWNGYVTICQISTIKLGSILHQVFPLKAKSDAMVSQLILA